MNDAKMNSCKLIHYFEKRQGGLLEMGGREA